jgi:phage terminase large subunit-like protein
MRASGDGKAEAVSASPNARDGARTTFQHADETHRFTLDHLRSAWRVMLANLGKRPIADPWALETTTAPEPGAGSTADATMEHARKVREHGEPAKSRLFFFHRQAADVHKTDTDVGLRAAIVEASGPFIAKWTDVDRILARFREPDADLPYLERVYLNRPVQAVQRAFDVNRWRELVKRGLEIPDGDEITIGFDGSRFDDATGLVATHILTGYQWPLGVWEKPSDTPSGPTRWEVEADQVSGVVDDAFTRWSVIRMYCDPEKWEQTVAHWAGQYGATRVLEWWTNRRRPMAYAIRSYCSAISAGELSHNGDPVFERHIGNSYRMPTNLVDEEKKPLWILRKERPDSEKKIDLAMAGVLSWEARNDALAAGHGAGSGWLMAAIQRK